jgi:hypothetical protein
MKKILYSIMALVFMVSGMLASPAKAISPVVLGPTINAGSWPVNVTQPGWTATDITNITGDGVFNGTDAVTGTAPNADFVVNYVSSVTGELIPQVIVTPGIPAYYTYTDLVIDETAHCPESFGLGVDPANPTLCAEVVGSHAVLVSPAWDETIVDKPAYDEFIFHPAITHMEYRMWVQESSVCPTDFSVYIYTNANHHDCRWSTKVNGKWYYANKIVTPAHWGDWQLGICRVHEDCVEPTCEQRTVVDHEAWTETIHHDAVTHVVHHDATYEDVIDYKYADMQPETYKCPDGFVLGLDQESPTQCAKLIDEVPPVFGCVAGTPTEGGMCQLPDVPVYATQEYTVNFIPFVEPTPVYLELWVCDGGALCFNIGHTIGPDRGCFLYSYTEQASLASSIGTFCAPAEGAQYHRLLSGMVTLLPNGTQCWGDQCENDVRLAEYNSSQGGNSLVYMNFFKK